MYKLQDVLLYLMILKKALMIIHVVVAIEKETAVDSVNCSVNNKIIA